MKAANASRETAGAYLRSESLGLVLGAGLLLMRRLLCNQSLCKNKEEANCRLRDWFAEVRLFLGRW